MFVSFYTYTLLHNFYTYTLLHKINNSVRTSLKTVVTLKEIN